METASLASFVVIGIITIMLMVAGMKTRMTIILVFVGMLMMAIVNLVIMVIGLASSIGAHRRLFLSQRDCNGGRKQRLSDCVTSMWHSASSYVHFVMNWLCTGFIFHVSCILLFFIFG